MVRRLHAIVPFAERARRVAGRLEGVGHGFFAQVHAFAAGRGAVNAEPGVQPAGEKFGAGRRTDRANVEAFEHRALGRELVDIRRAQVGVAVQTEIAPALVIGEKHHHVGRRVGGANGTETGEEHGKRKQESRHARRWKIARRKAICFICLHIPPEHIARRAYEATLE